MLEVPSDAYQSSSIAAGGDGVGVIIPVMEPNLKPAQKLISHFLSKDMVTGLLRIQSVAMGERSECFLCMSEGRVGAGF